MVHAEQAGGPLPPGRAGGVFGWEGRLSHRCEAPLLDRSVVGTLTGDLWPSGRSVVGAPLLDRSVAGRGLADDLLAEQSGWSVEGTTCCGLSSLSAVR
jgi:hypothetical protein